MQCNRDSRMEKENLQLPRKFSILARVAKAVSPLLSLTILTDVLLSSGG